MYPMLVHRHSQAGHASSVFVKIEAYCFIRRALNAQRAQVPSTGQQVNRIGSIPSETLDSKLLKLPKVQVMYEFIG